MLLSERWLSFQLGPGDVLFYVQDTSGQQDPGSDSWVTYNTAILNKGGNMNIDDGIFTAGVEGYYLFYFILSIITGWKFPHLGEDKHLGER